MPNKNTGRSTAARQLGRQGGLKGGPARAKKLTSTERSKIASMGGAAKAAKNKKAAKAAPSKTKRPKK